MLSLEDAQAAIAARIVRVDGAQSIALAGAVGRYTAEAVHARVDHPAFDNSAMDGYALNTALMPADRALPIGGESRCGSAPATLAPHTAMRIFTGAPLPAGADAVVIQENVRRDDARIVINGDVKPGDHIRRRGEDFRTGDTLFSGNRRLSAADVALLATAGHAQVSLWRRPRVLVIATGDELATPGTPLRPGQIYESNRLATLLRLQALGADAVDGGIVRDDPGALRAVLRDAANFDFVITSGGASVGDHDIVRQVFADIGTIDFWKVRIKPGKPLAFGRIGTRTHFFALPGNPVSSWVTFFLFVEPALAAWHRSASTRIKLPAITLRDFRREAGRREFLRARYTARDGGLQVEALAGQGSHRIAALRDANCFIEVMEDSGGFGAGDTVTIIPFAWD